jgi:uncharacterized protein DUF4238
LRKTRVRLTQAANFHLGVALSVSPILLDLKQILLVNRSAIPFIISDNPVLATNWFCRGRFPHRGGGWGRSGLQIGMPLSPQHALLLHDSNVYATSSPNDIITLTGEQTVSSLNDLQWLNAYQNIYFPPGLGDDQIQRLLAVSRGDESLFSFRRFERTGDSRNSYRATDKDEFAAPNEGVTHELVHFAPKSLPKDIRIKGVSIRAKPRYYDNGSMASPARDPAWDRIVSDFASAVEAKQCSFSNLWQFAGQHYLASHVGPWLARKSRRLRTGIGEPGKQYEGNTPSENRRKT